MRILLAGDTHGNSSHAQSVAAKAAREDADIVFQLGDFGYGWAFSQRKVTGELYDTFTSHVSKFAESSGVPWYWIDGNHEGFDALEALLATLEPQEDGTYEIEPNVFYVPRGTLLVLGGFRFLCCGGAASVDKKMRTPHVSWWAQEEITEADIEKCRQAGRADVLLTHDFPWQVGVIDRHLDPYWGEEAQRRTEHNRQSVSEILAWCDAPLLYHGHLHMHYTEEISHVHHGFTTRDMHRTTVTGLNRDDMPLSESTLLLDTEAIDGLV